MKIFCLLLLLLCSMNSMSQEKIPFEIRDGHFYRYGEKPLFFLERCIMSVYHTNIGATEDFLPSTIVTLLNEFHVSGKNSF